MTEPITTWTDYALGVVNLFFAIAIYSRMHPKNRVTGLLLLLGFLAQGVAAISGGTFHGFAAQVDPAMLRRFWNLSMLGVGAAVGFLASAIHAAQVRYEDGKWLGAGIVVGVLGLGIQVTGFRAHQPYNHNDIFHVIQIGAMCLFFKGVRNLEDRA